MIRCTWAIILCAAVLAYWAGLIVFLEADPDVAVAPSGELSRGLPPRSDL